MIFITGPLMSGKRAFACRLLDCASAELDRHAVIDAQCLADPNVDLDALADRLCERPVVIATEVGGGIVPIDEFERAQREAAGRLACKLAERADVVVRLFCGIPQVLKGELPA